MYLIIKKEKSPTHNLKRKKDPKCTKLPLENEVKKEGERVWQKIGLLLFVSCGGLFMKCLKVK